MVVKNVFPCKLCALLNVLEVYGLLLDNVYATAEKRLCKLSTISAEYPDLVTTQASPISSGRSSTELYIFTTYLFAQSTERLLPAASIPQKSSASLSPFIASQ